MSTSAGCRIRRAVPADAAAILALEELFPSDRMPARAVRRFLSVPSAQVFVATAGSAVLGNLILLTRRGARVARIYSVVVAPAARGQGLGQRLVERGERAARACGCLRLALEVRADNAAAQALYARLGYRLQTRLPAYYDDGADGLRLLKNLR